jgi:hypothetical protein
MKLLFYLSTLLFSPSCYWIASKSYNPDKRIVLLKSNQSRTDYLTIYKVVHQNCGCTTIYAEKFKGGNLTYSLSYACPTGLLPYLQLKEYDISKNVISKVCYRATDTDNYDTPLSTQDKTVANLLDSLSNVDQTEIKDYQLCIRTIKGFRKIECAY